MANVSNDSLTAFLDGIVDWLDCLSTEDFCDYVDMFSNDEHELWCLVTSGDEPDE
jgi:hypothetical protein